MLFFGKKAVREANEMAEKVEEIKLANTKKLDKAEASSDRLHKLLEANGITLRIYIATGGDRRHA